jgi:hypothetical protein
MASEKNALVTAMKVPLDPQFLAAGMEHLCGNVVP